MGATQAIHDLRFNRCGFLLIVLGWTAEIVGMFVKDPEKVCSIFLELTEVNMN